MGQKFLEYNLRFRIICLLICFLCLEQGAFAQIRLDDSKWLRQARTAGVEEVIKTNDSILIRTESSGTSKSFLLFPLGSIFLDPHKNNLFEVTMRTGPRIYGFFILWTSIGMPDLYYSVSQPIYRDGDFHTYLIPVDIPSWRGRISTIGLGWQGTRELVEIKRFELRSIGFTDRIRYHWTRFWLPEMPNNTTVNFVRGPLLLDQPLTFLLTLLFLAFLPMLYFYFRRFDFTRREPSPAYPPRSLRTRLQVVLWTLVAFWTAYDLREAYNHIQVLKVELRYYINTADRPRHLHGLDDFFDFLGFVERIVPASKQVGFYSGQFPFVYARYFLFPRRVSERSSQFDYIVIFHDPNITFRDGRLMEGENIIGDQLKLAGRFGEDAFVLERTND